MARSEKIEMISNQLRSRICSGLLKGGDLLVEEALAKEFSLSRTPIRQVLHHLALEHLVETKTGVGTIIIPEDRSNFIQDLRVYKNILKMSLAHANEDLSPDDEFQLSGLSSITNRLQKNFNNILIWDYFYRMGRLMAQQLGHDLISETATLLNARIFRRLIIALNEDHNPLVTLITQEYEKAKLADTGKDLLKVRISTISTIKKNFSNALK